MNRRSFNLSLLGLMAGCGGSDVGYPIQQSPTTKQPNTSAIGIEKDWSPTISCGIPGDLSVAYVGVSGYAYTLGLLVFSRFEVEFTPTYTTASGNLRIAGFPFQGSGGSTGGFSKIFSGLSEAVRNTRILCGGGSGIWSTLNVAAGFTDVFFNMVSGQTYATALRSGDNATFSPVQIGEAVSGTTVALYGVLLYTRQETAG